MRILLALSVLINVFLLGFALAIHHGAQQPRPCVRQTIDYPAMHARPSWRETVRFCNGTSCHFWYGRAWDERADCEAQAIIPAVCVEEYDA